jgi:uncharacterized protein (DUF362 family)
MSSKVALVRITEGHQKALQEALKLIGGIDDLNSKGRNVSVKIGIYDSRGLNYPTLEATKAVVGAFNHANKVFLAESDNHMQVTLKRLNIWRDVFTDRILPFSLTEDKDVRDATIIGEKLLLSHILFKPYVRVSFHAFRGLRGPGELLYGSILKNLLGIVPDINKERFHEKLGIALIDMIAVIDGLDLAVLDATYTYYGKYKEGKPFKRIKTDLIMVGRDAIAVDAVGFALVGVKPLDIPSLAEATKRGLGCADLSKIEVLGESLKNVKITIPK